MRPTTASGAFVVDVAQPHPAAALPFIELRIRSAVPATSDHEEHFQVLYMQIVPTGRMVVGIGVSDAPEGCIRRRLTVWDWKQGVSLGVGSWAPRP